MKGRFLKIFVSIFILILISTTCVFATNQYIPSPSPSLPTTEPKKAASNIIGSLMWIGYAIAIGMLIYIGIKYVIASADEKASMKGMLVKVVIGSLIIVCSTTIVNIVIGLAQ